MNFNRIPQNLIQRAIHMKAMKPSLHLPEEAQCRLCGRYNIYHPEVRRILTEAGYTQESAIATAECQCGTEEEKVARGAELDEIKKQWLGQATRSTIFIEHAKTIKDEDDERERRRRR